MFEDRIFASDHVGEVPLTAGFGENIQRMTLRPGIKRICWYTSRPLYPSLLVATGEKLQVVQELRPAAAQRLMSARTEGSQRLDTSTLPLTLIQFSTMQTPS